MNKQLNDLRQRIIDKEFQLESTIIPSERRKLEKVIKNLKKKRDKLLKKENNNELS